MNKLAKILLAFILFLILGLFTINFIYKSKNKDLYENVQHAKTISLGMSKREIIDIMGQPMNTEEKENTQVLLYQTPSIFADGIYFTINKNNQILIARQISDEVIK